MLGVRQWLADVGGPPTKPTRVPWMLENPWSAVGNPTSALDHSGSSFDPPLLAPTGIHHLLLSNLTTSHTHSSRPPDQRWQWVSESRVTWVNKSEWVTWVTGQLTDGSRGSRVKKCDPLSSLPRTDCQQAASYCSSFDAAHWHNWTPAALSTCSWNRVRDYERGSHRSFCGEAACRTATSAVLGWIGLRRAVACTTQPALYDNVRIARSLGDSWASWSFLVPAYPCSPGKRARVCVVVAVVLCAHGSSNKTSRVPVAAERSVPRRPRLFRPLAVAVRPRCGRADLCVRHPVLAFCSSE